MQEKKSSPAKKNSKQPKISKELSYLDRSPGPSKVETNQQSVRPTTGLVTQEQIAKKAYEIWNERGQPAGCDAEHWLEAERELLGRNKK
jgi:hypothetical protein